ncbi:hypothetical protein P879_11381 [Paragonimus westermani]|uniref:Mff-like domain-containing protein n=1 Tax=Paragonimus westermani TaxID=34504 RepID=A0A8T0D640_9TREM|nr:hypothetical protein P879_11381 [Paragonimus westermani]
MDPLIPKFSTYELDYTADIQHKMRVPDKISYDSDKSAVLGEDEPISLRNYTVADLVLDSNTSSLNTPGYSPDILTNADVRGRSAASASATAHAQGKGAVASANAQAATGLELHPKDSLTPVITSPTPSAASDIKRFESQVANLQKRVASLEFQQNLIGTGLTLYITFRILRWLLRVLE